MVVTTPDGSLQFSTELLKSLKNFMYVKNRVLSETTCDKPIVELYIVVWIFLKAASTS